jgi:hypothetical protein
MESRVPYRQGDVALVRVAKLPPGTKRVKAKATRPIVLAEGEVTGHAHTMERVGVAEYSTPQTDTRYIVAEVEAWLRHQEHAPITVEPGVYEIRHQREYAPGEIRRVAD